jgi:hypothetical protein
MAPRSLADAQADQAVEPSDIVLFHDEATGLPGVIDTNGDSVPISGAHSHEGLTHKALVGAWGSVLPGSSDYERIVWKTAATLNPPMSPYGPFYDPSLVTVDDQPKVAIPPLAKYLRVSGAMKFYGTSGGYWGIEYALWGPEDNPLLPNSRGPYSAITPWPIFIRDTTFLNDSFAFDTGFWNIENAQLNGWNWFVLEGLSTGGSLTVDVSATVEWTE